MHWDVHRNVSRFKITLFSPQALKYPSCDSAQWKFAVNAVTQSAQTEEEEEKKKKKKKNVTVTGTMSIYFPQIRSYVLGSTNY